MMWTI